MFRLETTNEFSLQKYQTAKAKQNSSFFQKENQIFLNTVVIRKMNQEFHARH